MKDRKTRVAWFAGTRGEILSLGPLFREFYHPRGDGDATHWFVFTGEHGMAAHQALDFLELHPHEECDLRHVAEDPAIRLIGLMEEIERFARRHRISHAIFTGFGPTATAASLVCHSRSCSGLWLRPADRANLNCRMRWEGGLEKIIRSVDRVQVLTSRTKDREIQGLAREDSSACLSLEFSGRRPDAPLALLFVGRPLWGVQGVLAQVVNACAAWARVVPHADWLIFRSLDARLEGPINSMPDRPSNLLTVPPLPYPEYAIALSSARVALTDSHAIATECVSLNLPLVALGEISALPDSAGTNEILHITPNELSSDLTEKFLRKAMDGHGSQPKRELQTNGTNPDLVRVIRDWSSVID